MTVYSTVACLVQLSSYRHACTKGESIYSSYSFLTSVLGAVSGQRHGHNLPPGKDPHGTHWTGGWVGWSGHRLEEKSFVCAGDRNPVVQCVVKTLY
jgi:hypothetical protein